jgi:hypothetical protein
VTRCSISSLFSPRSNERAGCGEEPQMRNRVDILPDVRWRWKVYMNILLYFSIYRFLLRFPLSYCQFSHRNIQVSLHATFVYYKVKAWHSPEWQFAGMRGSPFLTRGADSSSSSRLLAECQRSLARVAAVGRLC